MITKKPGNAGLLICGSKSLLKVLVQPAGQI